MEQSSHDITPYQSGKTLAAVMKSLLPSLSWSQVRRMISTRRVRVGGTVCVDETRRLKAGEVVEWGEESAAALPGERDVSIVYIDEHVIVVEKPAGMMTLRRPEEAGWTAAKKAKAPTLQEALESILSRKVRGGRVVREAVVDVHRLDRETSGLMLFARSAEAREKLIAMFKGHAVERVYHAVVWGDPGDRTIQTMLVRDRGDGLRGSTGGSPVEAGNHGRAARATQRAVTHVKVLKRINERLCLIECRLETGRTHQIRIHLSEIGHPICGERVYAQNDQTGAARQALHSTSIQFNHPITGKQMRFESAFPKDILRWLAGVDKHAPRGRDG